MKTNRRFSSSHALPFEYYILITMRGFNENLYYLGYLSTIMPAIVMVSYKKSLCYSCACFALRGFLCRY